LKLWKYEATPLRPDDIHIKITHCGICHSDIHTLDSGWGPTKYPVIVGHEIVGEVTELGSGVTKFKIGDRVGVGPQCSSCHLCVNCKVGKEQFCKSSVYTYNSTYPDGGLTYGGYAEAIRVPQQFAIAIPDGLLSSEVAPLLCAGNTVFTPLKKHMTPGCRVGVIGIGGLGHLAVQFASKLGALDVTAITSSNKKVADAFKLGATKSLQSSDAQAMKDAIRSLDLIICTVGSHEIDWDGYIKLLDVGGKLIVVGLPEEKIKVNLANLIYNGTSITGTIIGSPSDLEAMLEFAVKHDVKPWVQVCPMSEVNEALTKVRDNDVKFRYVLEN